MLHEYLLSYGNAGEFGRFRPSRPIVLRRGDRAVVRSHRGVELATVLCEARSGHAYFLPNTSIGQLLRAAGLEDEASAQRMTEKARRLFDMSKTESLLGYCCRTPLYDGLKLTVDWYRKNRASARNLVATTF